MCVWRRSCKRWLLVVLVMLFLVLLLALLLFIGRMLCVLGVSEYVYVRWEEEERKKMGVGGVGFKREGSGEERRGEAMGERYRAEAREGDTQARHGEKVRRMQRLVQRRRGEEAGAACW